MTQNRLPRGKPSRPGDKPRPNQSDNARSDKPRAAKPAYAKPSYAKPQQERAQPDRSPQERPANARPQHDRPKYEKPQFGKPQYDKPRADKPPHDRPQYDKPQYGKPRTADRPLNDRPQQARSQQARPQQERVQQERPQQGRPQNSRPQYDKPRTDRPQREHPDRPKQARSPLELLHDPSEILLTLPVPAAAAPQRPQQQSAPPKNRRGTGAPGRTPATPPGAVWLYGTHAVAAALQNEERLFRRLVITEEAQAALAAECPQPWPIQPEITERDKIDVLLGARQGSGIVHQGIALLTDQLTAPALLDAIQRPGPVIVLDQIFDPRNVGALMRTAQAFGACAVIAQDRNAPEETGALAKAASGALETIPLLRTVNIARAMLALKAADFWVVGLDGHAPSKLNGPSFGARRVALVLGSEGEGMRRLTRETCDEICALAMAGGMESLNVSAAGAVALYEITRKE